MGGCQMHCREVRQQNALMLHATKEPNHWAGTSLIYAWFAGFCFFAPFNNRGFVLR